MILIVSSPSGGGKTTIVQDLLEEVPGMRRSVSYTTRKPRKGERGGEDYIFVTEKEFKKKIEKDEFLEWEKTFGNYYGTSRKQVEQIQAKGGIAVLTIDVKGARSVKKKVPQSVSIFIMPPSKEELTERLKERQTEEREEVSVRLAESEREIASAGEYDYLVVNEDLAKATEELKTIIKKEQLRHR